MRDDPKRRRRRGGFTLAEMVISSGILAMTLGATVTAIVMYRRTVDVSNRHIQSVHDARRVMERLTSFDFFNAALQPGERPIPTGWGMGVSGFYRVDWTPGSRTKDLTVTVQYPYRWRAQPGSVSLTTSMSESLHP